MLKRPEIAAIIITLGLAAASWIFAAGGAKEKVNVTADQVKRIDGIETRVSKLEQAESDTRDDVGEIKKDVKELLRRVR